MEVILDKKASDVELVQVKHIFVDWGSNAPTLKG
jgi:hypothetical protein